MILLRVLGLLLDLLLAPIRLLRRRPRPGTWLELTIDGGVADFVAPRRFFQLRPVKTTSLHAVAELVDHALLEPRIKGLLLTIRGFGGGMAAATSLRRQLARARQGGKEVAIHLPMGGDTKEVYVACAASKVLLAPHTQLAPLGFRSASRYLKDALDRAGVEPQVFACGEFKSAGETLVRDAMSEPQRAQLERLLGGLHDELVRAIDERAGAGKGSAIVDRAPYFGGAALEAGLADDLAYEDEVPAKLGLEGRRGLMDAWGWLARRRRPLLRRVRRRPAIAVVPIHGAITHASGALGGVSTDERVGRMIRAARRDRRVRGVILHVDSPGGSALASDRMHHEIVQLGREKPVVVCMANVAASGGYYVAAPAECIVAEPTTVTGSIGVVAVRLSIEPLLARLGVHTEVVARGARSALLAPVGPLGEEDRAAIARELDATYRAFVGIVAAGREMDPTRVEELARGRVYTGKDALDVGLVDVLGGFDAAVEEVKRRLDPAVRAKVDVAVARTPRSAVEVLDPPRDPARALLGAVLSLLPEPDRTLVDVALTGEGVALVGPVHRT